MVRGSRKLPWLFFSTLALNGSILRPTFHWTWVADWMLCAVQDALYRMRAPRHENGHLD